MLPVLQQDLAWVLGQKSNCRLRFDNWMLTGPLIDMGPFLAELLDTMNMTVGSFVVNNKLVQPNRLVQHIKELGLNITDISLSLS